MRFDFFDRRSAERFAELLDESHRRHHHSRRPADEHLAELVAIGHGLSATPAGAARVDPEFRVGLRAMLVATAERDGIGATATDPDTEAAAPPALRDRAGLLGRGSARRIRARGAIVIGVAAGAMAVSGISAASENAAPGDALYGVKRQTEKAQLAMAGSDLTRGQLSLDFARTRLAEAAAMAGADRDFPAVLTDMDADTVQGVKLLTGSAVARTDDTPLATVDSFVTRQRKTFEPVLIRLSPGNRERAQASISLLDSVGRRTDALRAGLACGTVAPDGVDELGPRLRDCRTGTGATGSPAGDRPQINSERQGTRSPAGPAPTASARTVAPDTGTTGGGTVPDATPATGEPAPRGARDADEPVAPHTDEAPPGPQPTPKASATAPAAPPADDTGFLDGIVGDLLDGN